MDKLQGRKVLFLLQNGLFILGIPTKWLFGSHSEWFWKVLEHQISILAVKTTPAI